MEISTDIIHFHLCKPKKPNKRQVTKHHRHYIAIGIVVFSANASVIVVILISGRDVNVIHIIHIISKKE